MSENSNDKKAPVAFNSGVTQPQLSGYIKSLREQGIKEAKFDNGAYYQYNSENNKSTMAHQGIVYEELEHTYSLTGIKEGSSFQEATHELTGRGITQNTQAGMTGKSQTWVSTQQDNKSSEGCNNEEIYEAEYSEFDEEDEEDETDEDNE